MFRPGYAIEYYFFPPTQLNQTVDAKLISNLYFAVQINGTTGYEEAACQGLMAGINAHLKVQEKDAFILNRSDAYIGVLIDDLINKGTNEPYRMFTSRAEYRLLLRQDNADLRLTPKGYEIGLATEHRYDLTMAKMHETKRLINDLKQKKHKPADFNPMLESIDSAPVKDTSSMYQVLKRPNITLEILSSIDPELKKYLESFNTDVKEQAEIQIKYETYIERERENSEKMTALENRKINPDFDYSQISSLSSEAREKLLKIKPSTLGQASRISGVSASDVSILMVYLNK